MTNPLYVEIRDSLNSGDIGSTFIQKMGWGAPAGGLVRTQAVGQFWQGKLIANLKGFNVILVELDDMPDTSVQREVDKALFKHFAERITIFQTPSITSWLWPRKRASGFLAAEKYEYTTGSIPDYLAQKLAAISFSVSDHTRGITLGQVRDKVRGQFDTSAVTKKFYEDFKNQHEALTAQVSGLPESEAHAYSSLMLNRLMFIYFLQKKEFINGDANYLRTCLDKLEKLNSGVKFYSFYKDLLRTLFFDGLNRQPHEFNDPQIAEILGDPPYINGGIFGASDLEQSYDIDIPDKAFEDIFNLFDSYRWHLDTSPTGNSNEINPEVIGYIFEQYINYTANGKKEKGAYYTPQDVCGFMAKNTIVPHLVKHVLKHDPFAFDFVKASPAEYLLSDMLSGWDNENNEWLALDSNVIATWKSDPKNWQILDSQVPPAEVCLPGESWIELLHRRQRVERIFTDLSNGFSESAEEFIDLPLNSLKILTEYLSTHSRSELLEDFWYELESLSVIDPTCGSGAFLFAALEVLEDIYISNLEGLERVAPWATSTKIQEILEAKKRHANERYYVRKLISLNNLFGTDLMGEAIETAKLRLFLSLVACLESGDQLEPLPDLDFNFKAGNLVVGFYDSSDAIRVSDNIWAANSLDELLPKIQEFENLQAEFKSKIKSLDHSEVEGAKKRLLDMSKSLRESCNKVYGEAINIEPSLLDEWAVTMKPFHWFIEFPEVIRNGGFNIVIGNPPYIKSSTMTPKEKNAVVGFVTRSCPDFYAVCFERSLQILSETGHHAFIVMSNLAFGKKFASLREVISDKGFSEWWATFGKRPDSLFKGIQVRNTILILTKGTSKSSTHHKLFTAKSRQSLFTTIEYTSISRNSDEFPLRGGLANEIVELISKSNRSNCPMSESSIFSSRSATYWYSVLPDQVPILDANGVPVLVRNELNQEIRLLSCEPHDLALALLGGKLGYLWWASVGDDFNSGRSYGEKVLGLLNGIENDSELIDLAKVAVSKSKDLYFASANAKAMYINIRWSEARIETDAFDYRVLELLGVQDLWRDLNIWYRQAMKSSGSNSNSIKFDSMQAKNHVIWYKNSGL